MRNRFRYKFAPPSISTEKFSSPTSSKFLELFDSSTSSNYSTQISCRYCWLLILALQRTYCKILNKKLVSNLNNRWLSATLNNIVVSQYLELIILSFHDNHSIYTKDTYSFTTVGSCYFFSNLFKDAIWKFFTWHLGSTVSW